MRYAIDPTKIHEELGWLPETKFADGIQKTIEWYLNNQDWVEEVTSGDYQKTTKECTERNNRYRIKARLSNKPKNSILREVSPNMLFSFLPSSYGCHSAPGQYMQTEVDAGSPDKGKRLYFAGINKP